MEYYILRKNGDIIYKGGDFQQVDELLPTEYGVNWYDLLSIRKFGVELNIRRFRNAIRSKEFERGFVESKNSGIISLNLKDLEQLVKEAKK